MNVSKIGVTQILPKTNKLYKDFGANEIRHRLLKDGSIAVAVYKEGKNISDRFMLLKKGIDDIRYLSMLKKYRHIKEVDKFLTQAPLKVVTSSHNPTLADKVRQETIKLLLKYHK